MKHQHNSTVIGVDLGATKIRAGRVRGDVVEETYTSRVSADAAEEVVVKEVVDAITHVYRDEVTAIGVGVPSVVDVDQGIVYDVQNIPSWQEVPLKDLLTEHFAIPVYINNDANCFALGESYFGCGRGTKDLVGLIIGTGMAAGLVFDGKLFCGRNCGAGEVGMIPYLDQHFEYYCSGQFFELVHGISGEALFRKATSGDPAAQEIFSDYGRHLAQGIKAVLFAYDPEMIVLGGSVSRAYPFFEQSMRTHLSDFPYRSVLQNLQIEVSTDRNIAVLGAAALYYDAIPAVNDKFMVE